jgi:predicted amino acid dehydrogenase
MMTLPKEKVRKKILEAVLFSQEKLGAELLMLGALTAPLTSAGKWLIENPKVKLNVTTGNSYTSAVAIEAAEEAMDLANLDFPKTKMAIIGAAGVIGGAISRYFNQKGANLLLVERTPEKFERLKPYLIGENYKLTCNIKEIITADLIITATSHPDVLINPEILRKKAIVIDVTEPSDLPSNIEEVRPDVIAIDGGRVKWENIDVRMDLGVPKNIGFACMTEVILQALEERRENYIGSIDLEHLKETQNWAKKWGFELADFTCFNKPIPLEKFKTL